MPLIAANNALASLQAPCFASDTTITLKPNEGTRFPEPNGNLNQAFMLTIQNGALYEIVRCTARAGDVLTVVRGQEGTQAASWPVDSSVENRITAGYLNESNQNAEDAKRLSDQAVATANDASSRIANAVVKAATAIQVMAGALSLPRLLLRRQAEADRGGYFQMEVGQSSTLDGGSEGTVRVDLFGDRFRVYEEGAAKRGFYLDLSLMRNMTETQVWHSQNFNPDSQNLLNLTLKARGGSEGGEISLSKPVSGTTLPGTVTVDIEGDSFRVFTNNPENTSSRGVAVNLMSVPVGVIASLWHSSNFNPRQIFPYQFAIEREPGTPDRQGAGFTLYPMPGYLNGIMRFDMYDQRVRIFETEGSHRGVYLDLYEAQNEAGSKIWHSGNFNAPAAVARLDGLDLQVSNLWNDSAAQDAAALKKTGDQTLAGWLQVYRHDASQMVSFHRDSYAHVGISITDQQYWEVADLYGGLWRFHARPNGDLGVRGIVYENSDRRLKSDIRPLENALDIVLRMQGRRYVHRGQEEVGFIGDEVLEAGAAEMVSESFQNAGEDPILTVAYNRFSPYAVEAIKTIAARLEAVERKLDALGGE